MLRTYGIARALAAHRGLDLPHQGLDLPHRGLDLLYVRFGAQEPDAAFRAIPGIELHEVVPSRGAGRLLAYAQTRLAGTPGGFARGVSKELSLAAERLARDPERGRVIADGPSAAAALKRLADSRPVIYNAHNIESGFRHEVERRGLETPRSLRRFERRVLGRSSESWMVSEADMAAARELCPRARLRYVPNVVDVAAITPVSGSGSGLSIAEPSVTGSPTAELPVTDLPTADLLTADRRSAGPPCAIFVASFHYRPNQNGLRFLLEEVFPRVWAQLPQARLLLVGGGLERDPSDDPRVEALGFVEDLPAAYARATCAVVPLLQGGGTPLKLIEALAYGLPTIATPRAAAALAVVDGEHCLIREGAQAFAEALVEVLRRGDSALGRRGRELVAERYSIEALGGLLEE
jgi:glycosyltransferase involved in cell wall biosynthesis